MYYAREAHDDADTAQRVPSRQLVRASEFQVQNLVGVVNIRDKLVCTYLQIILGIVLTNNSDDEGRENG